ncbi:MAG: zinc-binding dehydrogenase [Verrucomicrobia bacterium]|nr:zinc-binding dehydrogenase [Verrucomicrobiota bacterium]
MKAAILVENNKPLVVAELRVPEKLSFGQVHVKIHYSGICGAQINEIEGAKGPDKFLPHLLGHEGSGTVTAVGAGVKTVKPGDHVVLHWRPSAGLECETPKYDWNGRTVNAGWVTTFNDEAIVSENRLTVIPPDFDLRLAPLFGCAVTTAIGVINNDAQLKIGQSIVIFGIGGVGLNIAQAAAMVSAYPVIGVDIVDAKMELAKQWGVTHTFNSSKTPDLSERIREIVGPQGADVVVDTTGNARVIESAYDLTHSDGRTILVGVPRKGDKASIYTLPLHFKKVLKGSHGGSAAPDVEIPRLIRLIRQNRMKLDGLFTHEFKLDEINEAIRTFRSGEAGRILINMQNAPA